MRKIFSITLVLFILTGTIAWASPSDWAVSTVKSAISSSLVPANLQKGYQDLITREEFCQLSLSLYIKIGAKLPETQTNPFSDTQSAEVATAFALGIVQGVSDDEFAPSQPVSRQELCAMLLRAIRAAIPSLTIVDSYPNSFADEDQIYSWAVVPVKYLNIMSIVMGAGEGNFDPLGNATREQAIAMSYRAYVSMVMRNERNMAMAGGLFSDNGNTNANSVNMGFAIMQGESVYVAAQEGIFKFNMLSAEKSKISAVKARNMVVGFSEMYFTEAEKNTMYRMSNEGGNMLALSQDDGIYLMGHNDRIFYSNLSDGGKLYSVSRAGEERALELDDTASEAVVLRNKIYYNNENGIFVVDADGRAENKEKLWDGRVRSMHLTESVIYFINQQDGRVHALSIDTKESTVVIDKNVRGMIYSKGEMYYSVVEEDALYKTKAGEDNAIRFHNQGADYFNTAGHWVFGYQKDGGVFAVTLDASSSVDFK